MAKAKPADAGGPTGLEKQFYDLLSKANRRGASDRDVDAFREHLTACERAGLKPWRNSNIKTLGEAAESFALDKAGGAVMRAIPEVWRRQLEDLRATLGYDVSPPLERTLIEHLSLCWLRLNLMELRYDAVMASNTTFKHVEHTERRLSEAQKRYTRACEALARVRKLKLPALQVNIAAEGGRQVNVAG
jgi:hypothetical protein